MAPVAFLLPEYERARPTGRQLLAHPACLELVNGEGAAEPLTRSQVMRRGAHGMMGGDLTCAGCGGNVLDEPRTIGVDLDAADDFARPRSIA